jgi:hypothetical protein
MRIRTILPALCLLALLSGCTSGAKRTEFAGYVGMPVSYNKVVHPMHGTVGYVEVKEYTAEGKGDAFRLYHVLDLNYRERGILTPTGTGTRFVDLPSEIALVKGRPRDEVPLEAQTVPWNVAVCLDFDPRTTQLALTPARPEDFTPSTDGE